MIKHSTSTPAPKTPPAILLIGPPGGGKTALMMQFPSLYFADIDLNTTGPLALNKHINPAFTVSFDRIALLDDGTPVAVEKQFARLKSCIKDACKNPEFKTIGVDGLTHLDNILKAHVMANASKSEMDRSLWIPFRKELIDFIMTCRNSGKTFLMLCHEEYKEKEVKGQGLVLEKRTPLVSSKITDAFGGFFTDVFRCYPTLGIGNKPEFCIDISPTQYDALKNSYRLHGTIKVGFEESAWTKVNQMLKLS